MHGRILVDAPRSSFAFKYAGAHKRILDRMRERCGAAGHFIPQFHELVEALRDQLMSHPIVVAALDECKKHVGVTVMGVEGQYSTLLSVLDQSRHGQKQIGVTLPMSCTPC